MLKLVNYKWNAKEPMRLKMPMICEKFPKFWVRWKIFTYSCVPITRHSMFIRHTPCIWPDTFIKRWDMMFNRIRTKRKRAVPFNWIMLFWSVSILRGVFPYEPLLVFGSCHSKWQLWLIFHPIHFQSCEPLLLFSTWHKRSGEPLCLFSTPLLIGTRE